MEIVIDTKRENKLLGREEIWLTIKTNAPVTRKDLKTRLKAEFGVDENLIVVDKILPVTGTPDMKAFVKIYKDAEHLEKIEPKYMIERNKVVEENAENEGQAESQA